MTTLDPTAHLTSIDLTEGPAEDAIPPSSMRVIVFSSQKGGSGKTTLCGQLAVQAELSGVGPVALVDADPQGSLAQWWNARASDTPMFVKTGVQHLGEDLEELRRMGVRLVFVDTPPSVTDVIAKIVAHADLVVIPTRPSPHDLRAVGATLDIVEGQDKSLIFVVNAATPKARITSDVAVALSQHGTVAPINIHQRTAYATSMIDGRTVMETKANSPAAREIRGLWAYIHARLGRIERRNQVAAPCPAVEVPVVEAARAEPREVAVAAGGLAIADPPFDAYPLEEPFLVEGHGAESLAFDSGLGEAGYPVPRPLAGHAPHGFAFGRRAAGSDAARSGV